MAWGTRIFALAAARGWSHQRLAGELGVHRTTLYRLRTGRTEVSAHLLRRAEELFGDDGEALFWPLPETEGVPA